MSELEPLLPPHTSNHTITIDPEPPDHQLDAVTASDDEKQWINNDIHSTTTNITNMQDQYTIDANAHKYTQFVRKLQENTAFDKRLQQVKRRLDNKSILSPPQAHALYIPTLKSSTIPSLLHGTTWRNHECSEWIDNATGGWDAPETSPPATPHIEDMDDIATAHKVTTIPVK